MQTKNYSIISRLFARVLGAFSPLKCQGGGGVSPCKKALLRAFSALFAAFFAMGFLPSAANAQTAEAQVFTRETTVIPWISGRMVDLSDNLAQIAVEGANGNPDFSMTFSALASFLPGGGRMVSFANSLDNGIPVSDGRALREGDLVRFNNSGFSLSPEVDITVRIYLNQAGGGATDLFVIDSEATFRNGVADPNAGEFYLDANWVRTDDITQARGWNNVCPADRPFTDTVNGGCTAGISAADCAGMTTPQVQNGSGGCRLPNGDADCRALDLELSRNPPLPIFAGGDCTEASTGGTPTPGGGTTPTTQPQKSDNGFPVVGGVVAAVLIFGLSQAGTAGEFAFSPDFGYGITESGYSANVGGRMDFRKDKWHLYYAGGQTNRDGDFGDFRYESGGEYKTDFWKAAFSESVQGEKADYDFALSADFGNRIWNVSPNFAIDSEYDRKKDEWTTENSFRISGEMRYDKWNFSANTDAERFRFNAIHRF